ncbi:hypothetical protein EJK15_26795 [Nonomuraea basaltis]|nr:hypothetical protein EJK15_26795 [Nonomuraea basaltis]
MRQKVQQGERRRRLITIGLSVALGAGAVGALSWGIVASRGADVAAAKLAMESALPPWPLPADPLAGARAAGLSIAGEEGTAKHFHSHLDVFVNGERTPVPGNIGVSESAGAMSELHTHDEEGILHVEAPTTDKTYTLKEVFTSWQVQLDARGIGGLKNDGTNVLKAYVNGKEITGDPATVELTDKAQIALVYGSADSTFTPPATYDWSKSGV